MKKMKKGLLTLVLCMCLCGVFEMNVLASGYVSVSNVTSSTVDVDWSAALTMYSQYGYIYNYADVYIGDDLIISGTTATNTRLTGLQANTYYQVIVYAYFTDDAGKPQREMEYEGFVTGTLSDVDTGVPGGTDTTVTPSTPSNTTPGSTDTTTTTNNTTTVALATPQVSKLELVNGTLYVEGGNVDPYAQKLEWQIYDAKTGNCVATDESYTLGSYIYNLNSRKVFYAICRVVGYDSQYNDVYSEWSARVYFVAQPKVTTSAKHIKKNSVTIKWKKVTGAKSYTVYAKKKSASKWVKVKTTTKTSYKLTKIKGKRINTRANDYSFRVVTNAKVGNTTIHSGTGESYYTYWY